MFNNPWVLAIRPKTLPAALAPVMIGSAMAFGDGVFHLPSALCCLCAALLLQIGTNLANDYFDFKKGADVNRSGPTRVTQAGLIKPPMVLAASLFIFALAVLCSVYLINRAGNVLLIVAIASVLSGIFYTAGKKPLGYLGLGELFVFIFFGPVAVTGTYYAQSFEVNDAVLLAGFAPGFLSCAIIGVNNLRDMDGDRRVGKKTLAVRFGRSFATSAYLWFILAASFIPFIINEITEDHRGIIAASSIAFMAVPLIKTVFTSTDGVLLNKVLAKTGLLLVVYAVIFSGAWILCSR